MKVLKDKKRLGNILRKAAKIWSLLIGVFLLLMLIGEVVFPHEGEGFVSIAEIVALVFFPFGVMAGMGIAWKWERLGGIITIISLIIFYILILIPRSAFRGIPMSLLIAGPGFLFLVSSFLAVRRCGGK